MSPIGEMDHDFDGGEMLRPIGLRPDITDRAKFNTGNRIGRPPRSPKDSVAALDQTGTQRPADEAGRTRN